MLPVQNPPHHPPVHPKPSFRNQRRRDGNLTRAAGISISGDTVRFFRACRGRSAEEAAVMREWQGSTGIGTQASSVVGFLFAVVLLWGVVWVDLGVRADRNPTVGRKLLAAEVNKEVTERIIGQPCSKDDISVYQGETTPLPNGIPTFTVQILNMCISSGCTIADIHLNCGWFSSARTINPRVFRRLGYDNCLVNDGAPLGPGGSLSFQYANSYQYPLSVAFVRCY